MSAPAPYNLRLYRLARLLLAYESPEDVLRQFLIALCEDLRADAGYLVARRSEGFRPVAAVRYNLENNVDLQFSATAVRKVLRELRPLVVQDIQQTPWLRTAASISICGVRALVCVPILLRRQAVAALYLEQRHGSAGFPSGSVQYLTESADLCASVLARRLDGNPEASASGAGTTPFLPRQEQSVVPLSPMEERVVRELTSGATNRQIAERLGVTRETIKVHLDHIYTKLGVRSRTAVAFRCRQPG